MFLNNSKILCNLVAALFLGWGGNASSEPAKYAYALRGLQVISVSLEAGSEVITDLGRFENRPVLIEVWASWCGPCLTALPLVQRLQGDFPALQVLPISVDDGIAEVSQAYARTGITDLPVYLDKAGSMMSSFKVRMYPTTLLFDSCGKIVFRQVGAKPGNDKVLRQNIERLLSSSCSTGKEI